MNTSQVAYLGDEPITVEQAKAYLHVDAAYTADDELIYLLINAARNHAEVYTSQAIRHQRRTTVYDCFQDVLLVSGPVIAIESVAYTTDQGESVTVAAEDYFTVPGTHPLQLRPKASWPSDVRAVTVTYTCGFADATQIPTDILLAMRIMIADWYENRMDGVRRFPTTSQKLLDLHRKTYFA